MITLRTIHHPNDVTNIYLTKVMPEALHDYFQLPGKFVRNYTTRIVKRDGSEGDMDWLMLVEPDGKELFEPILINVEFQSTRVTKQKIKSISEYKDYAKTYYGLPVLSVIIITSDYEGSELEYSKVPSDILKPIYIKMDYTEIIERLNNLEEKINNHEKLHENDSLDMVFLPMFASKSKAKWITEKISQLFVKDKSVKRPFKDHIGYGLSIMVKKNFGNSSKAEELLNMLKENVEDPKLRIIAEFEDEYAKQVYDRKLAEKDNTITKIENTLKEKENTITEKNNEIKALKSILKANRISC